MDRILYEGSVKRRSTYYRRETFLTIVMFGAYALATSTAFLLKSFLNGLPAPLEVQNIVLIIFALLTSRADRQWIYLLSAYAAHVTVSRIVGEQILQATITFLPNVVVSLLSAAAIRQLLSHPPWLTDLRKTLLYVIVIGFLVPAVSGVVSLSLQVPIQHSLGSLLDRWLIFFFDNSLTNLTFLPLALLLTTNNLRVEWQEVREHALEILALLSGLLLLCVTVSSVAQHTRHDLLPLLIYAPTPIVLWITARFGIKGSAIAIAAVALISLLQIPTAAGFSIVGSTVSEAATLQILIIGITVPFLLLGAAVDQFSQTKQVARRNENRMTSALSAANIALWQFSRGDNQFWCTDRCATLFGMEPGSPLSVNALVGAVHLADRDTLERVLKYAPHTDQEQGTEFRVYLRNGEIRWLKARSHRLGKSGPLETISGIFSDITPCKRVNDEMAGQRLLLAHGMRVAQVSALSANLAHELTQPLTSILANSQAAHTMLNARRPDLREIASILNDIISDNNRAAAVIGHVRSFLRKDSEDLKNIDPNQLIISTLELIRTGLVAQHISIEKNLDELIPTIVGDSTQLQQVLLNFLTNAIDALHDLPAQRRKITISTRQYGEKEIEFSVSDTGVGMTEENEKRVFDPFYTTKHLGLGLGLSICSKIIERHGGRVGIERNPDYGVTVWFRLPRGPQEA